MLKGTWFVTKTFYFEVNFQTMQKALQQAIMQETRSTKYKNIHSRDENDTRPNRDTATITSADIFAARTLESRFVISHYEKRSNKPNVSISANRNLLRRGRSSFVKRYKRKKSKNRQQTNNKIDGGKAKKLLRYQKRKPFHLLQEKTKNLNSGWLTTHLWHAKRCKMRSIWGYKLAARNLQHAAKSFRSTIRQLTEWCTLHDASYWNVIALHGAQSQIIKIIKPLIAPFQQSMDQCVLDGYSECELYLYKKGCYPFDFLCTVKCSFNAIQINVEQDEKKQSDEEQNRICWLWCHASVYKALFKLLEECANDKMEVRNESRKFVRFELRGPMSSFVLEAASECAVPNLMEDESAKYIKDGNIMSSQLICDPKHYSVAQPFVLSKSMKNNSKTLQFQLKEDFVKMRIPSQHPLMLINQMRMENYRLREDFHFYFEQTEDVEMKSNDDAKKQKKKKGKEKYLFPFMMIAKRYFNEEEAKMLPIRNKIVGWDIIIPVHTKKLKSFIPNEPSIEFASMDRFWWNNLYFAGGRVIGYEQKMFMRLEMKRNQSLFPMDYLDSKASIHYWLKYYKHQIMTDYFKKPKSKRINPYPAYPFTFWPNLLLLFQTKDKMKSAELTDIEIKKNLLQMEKYEKESNKKDKEGDIEMDAEKQCEYLLNYTLWGFKHNSDLMNNLRIDLKSDVIECFDKKWNLDKYNKYFIVRDVKILQNIKESIMLQRKIDLWNEDMINVALVIVNIRMNQKGVPTSGNPMFINDKLFGYVIYGGYSSICGGGIGVGIVRLSDLLKSNQEDRISVVPFWNYPNQRHECTLSIAC